MQPERLVAILTTESVGQLRQLSQGEWLFNEGDASHDVYVVKSGQVAVIKQTPQGKEVAIGYVKVGEVVGEVAALTRGNRTACARADSETVELWQLSQAEFWQLIHNHAELALPLLETMSHRCAATTHYLHELFDCALLLLQEKERSQAIAIREADHETLRDIKLALAAALEELHVVEQHMKKHLEIDVNFQKAADEANRLTTSPDFQVMLARAQARRRQQQG